MDDGSSISSRTIHLTAARRRGRIEIAHRLLHGILPRQGNRCQTRRCQSCVPDVPCQGCLESFHRKRAVSAEVCLAGGSCSPSDRAHFTKIASIKLLQDRCSRAAASRIHRIQACEPRTDNPGCALIPPPVAVLTACLPPENSSHLHTNTRVNHTASVFASPSLATFCGFQAPRPNEPRRNRAHFS